MSRSTAGRLLLALLAAALLHLPSCEAPRATPEAPEGQAEAAYRQRLSGVMVEVSGRVERLLPDDAEGSRHQRFILELPSGHTLLVTHNIDVAARVPVERGDELSVRGRYEWNEKGGVVHWTHRDPSGGRPGGWIRREGRTYR